MGKASRDKGARREREAVERFRAMGVHAERVPLSGASRYRGNGSDVDCYLLGIDECPVVAEVKARKDGAGFKQLETWLGPDGEMLVLQADRSRPLYVLTQATMERIAEALCHANASRNPSGLRLEEISAKPATTGDDDNGTAQTSNGSGSRVA